MNLQIRKLLNPYYALLPMKMYLYNKKAAIAGFSITAIYYRRKIRVKSWV